MAAKGDIFTVHEKADAPEPSDRIVLVPPPATPEARLPSRARREMRLLGTAVPALVVGVVIGGLPLVC